MSEKKGIIVILSVIAGLIIVSIILSSLLKSGSKIPENDPWLSGTTAGNVYHGGLFCERDGVVYFSNAYDGGSLYCMQPGQTELTKLVGGDISHINIAGDYLYYYSRSIAGQAGLGYVMGGRGIYRSSLDGKKVSSLNAATSDGLLLLGNSLYFTNFASGEENSNTALVTLNMMNLNGEDEIPIANDHPQLGAIANGILYYSSMDGNYTLQMYDPSSGSMAAVITESMYQPIIQNDTIYYMDIHDNYHLKSRSLYGGESTTIVSERIDSFNVMNAIIYYQTCDSNYYALKRIYIDGTGEELVREGAYHNINMTSDYVYFTEFNSDYPVYQTPTFGGVYVTTFDAAFNAAADIRSVE